MDTYPHENKVLAKALEKAAHTLETEAARLCDMAQLHRRFAANWARLNAHVATAPHLVDWLMAKGSNDPFTQAADRLGVEPEFVEAHYARFIKAYAARERRQRNREIVRLAKAGEVNKRIAARCAVSVSTVKRVLKEEDLGRYRYRAK